MPSVFRLLPFPPQGLHSDKRRIVQDQDMRLQDLHKDAEQRSMGGGGGGGTKPLSSSLRWSGNSLEGLGEDSAFSLAPPSSSPPGSRKRSLSESSDGSTGGRFQSMPMRSGAAEERGLSGDHDVSLEAEEAEMAELGRPSRSGSRGKGSWPCGVHLVHQLEEPFYYSDAGLMCGFQTQTMNFVQVRVSFRTAASCLICCNPPVNPDLRRDLSISHAFTGGASVRGVQERVATSDVQRGGQNHSPLFLL